MKKTLFVSIGFILLTLVLGGVAFAEESTGMVTKTQSSVDFACVQTAVNARETAIQTAFSTFSASMSAALSARGTALSASWGMSDSKARRESRNTAWSSYRKSAKDAAKALKTAKSTAWNTFKSASKACKVPVVESEAETTSVGL